MMLPDWLLRKDDTPCPQILNLRGRKGFADRTIETMTGLVREALFGEKIARRNGFMQKLAPKTKIAFMAIFLVTASLARSARLLLLLYLFLLLLALLSGMEPSFFIARVWVFIPLFSAFMVFPAIFNFITPGDTILSVAHFNGDIDLLFFTLPGDIAVTRQGVGVALLFILRVAVSVSTVVLAQLSTRWHELLFSLRVFRVPSIFILVLEMCYRYIFLLATIISDMHLAKKSRTIRPSPASSERRWASSRMAFLLKRSLKLSNDVYGAMISRGFSGEVKTLAKPSLKRGDYGFLAVAIGACAFLLYVERYLWVIA